MNNPISEPSDGSASMWRRTAIAVALLAPVLGAGLLGIYGIGGLDGNASGAGKCRAAIATAARLTPLARDGIAALVPAQAPRDLSDLAFREVDGREVRLSAWRGRVVLLNLWATWCVPCRVEMPALDRLQARAGSADFEVVTVNLDTRDPEKPKAFLRDIAVTALTHRSDPSLGIFKTLQKLGLASGLPTTLLIDREGCELGRLAGPAEWDGAAALDLVAAAVAASPAQTK